MPTLPQEHAVERAARIYTRLKEAAERGEICPMNQTLAERFGCNPPTIVRALHFLESNAMISVKRGNGWRVVTITATGKSTRKPDKHSAGQADPDQTYSLPDREKEPD